MKYNDSKFWILFVCIINGLWLRKVVLSDRSLKINKSFKFKSGTSFCKGISAPVTTKNIQAGIKTCILIRRSSFNLRIERLHPKNGDGIGKRQEACGRNGDFGMCILFVIFTHKFIFMRTNIELDDVLVNQAIKLSKLRTKREVIQEALKSYVASMKKRQLLNLKGRVSWEGNLKEMRSL
jgi:Arc/MetJ family transcription regulator